MLEHMTPENTSPILSALNTPAIHRRRKIRVWVDRIAKHSMTFGGISVIIAILLIFFYLLYVVFPLLKSADIQKMQQFSMPAPEAGRTLYLATEEKNEVGVRFTDQGHIIFFDMHDGQVISNITLSIPTDVTITSFAVADPTTRIVAYGLSNGQALVLKHDYKISYAVDNFGKDQREIAPYLEYPLEKEPITIDEQGSALTQLDIQLNEDANTLAAITANGRLLLVSMVKQVSFIDESVTLERAIGELTLGNSKISHLLLDKDQRVLYMADHEGRVWRVDVTNKSALKVEDKTSVVDRNVTITAIEFLTGDISLLIGDSQGRITQWFPVRDAHNKQVLTRIREFNAQSTPITNITIEERRKGFVAADNIGQVGIYHSTAHRTLLVEPVAQKAVTHVAISPRADVLLVEDAQDQIATWAVHNEHPEISWSALWEKVWYESQSEPDYIWQSSASTHDFEPKFSLTPLAFGTIKAAFYAMIVAVPLAIFGAIYTAYFMAPGMRKIVKPTIEIMEALPTVILGFLAGLWLAPTVEAHLPGVFTLLILLPIGVLIFSYVWHLLPKPIRHLVPDGWQAMLLVPVILLLSWLSFSLSAPMEIWFFNGNMPEWLETQWGINFDQRNALIVGIAMGVAVIPNIFSITEDAVFSVPKHLTTGSLALGATPWQTMMRVVILTASPGIFSAVMIGMGRAVGETMIVLMATGNTPVMDFSLFQGLRTLSANIAVEMPESEVNSTHYRILFLAGLVLFIFTFFFNTLAEIVRHRLRRKYSSL